MFGIENYLGFILAGLLLNLTPGADTMFILTRSVSQGQRAGLYSVLGIATGGLVHTVLASLGLSIILSQSHFLFVTVKYVGVGYLIYIGLKMLNEKSNLFDNKSQKLATDSLFKIYRQGVFTNVLNPKVALFFISFLPQFINPEYTKGPLPFLLLGLTFVTTMTLWYVVLAYSASLFTHALRDNESIGKIMQRVSGCVFIALGIKLLVDKK
jgi:RhtB (resistance to homoserine/threonine) family protein